jgi:hypothetical protein
LSTRWLLDAAVELMFEALAPNEELRTRFVELHRQIGTVRGVARRWRLDSDEFDPVPALAHVGAADPALLVGGARATSHGRA